MGYQLVALDAPNNYREKQAEVAQRLSGSPIAGLLPHCEAKDGQDLLAAALNDFRPGYFIDVGAYDGRTGSNTHLLEKQLGWHGLMIEPNLLCHAELRQGRSATLDTRAIDVVDGATVLLELEGQMSRLRSAGMAARQQHRSVRVPRTASVRTATTSTIFAENAVPQHVHYVSIDVEGLELAVLQNMPFERHTIDYISVEHNYDTVRRADMRAILAEHDYFVVHEALSRNEDWFVRRALTDHPAIKL